MRTFNFLLIMLIPSLLVRPLVAGDAVEPEPTSIRGRLLDHSRRAKIARKFAPVTVQKKMVLEPRRKRLLASYRLANRLGAEYLVVEFFPSSGQMCRCYKP